MTDALATKQADDAAALAALLADPEVADGYDGYSDSLGADRIRIARLKFNTSGTDANNKVIPVDAYYNTSTETIRPVVEAVLAHEHTKRKWLVFDDAEQRNRVVCSSDDRVTGHLRNEVGDVIETRACKGCKDAEWHTGPKGKRSVNCNEHHEVLGLDLETHEPFIITYKSTSEKVILKHLERHHTNKRRLASGRLGNIPLYAFTVRLTATLQPNGKWAMPNIERTGVTAPEVATLCRETSAALREAMASGKAEVDADTSFDPDKFNE
jgi:hypothetical protein